MEATHCPCSAKRFWQLYVPSEHQPNEKSSKFIHYAHNSSAKFYSTKWLNTVPCVLCSGTCHVLYSITRWLIYIQYIGSILPFNSGTLFWMPVQPTCFEQYFSFTLTPAFLNLTCFLFRPIHLIYPARTVWLLGCGCVTRYFKRARLKQCHLGGGHNEWRWLNTNDMHGNWCTRTDRTMATRRWKRYCTEDWRTRQ